MLDIVILSAGEGTRMKSKYSKVMHKVCGAPIIDWVVSAAEELSGGGEIIAVVGNSAESVREFLGERVVYAEQKERLGTGHAAMQAKDLIASDTVLVLAGDAPLITAESLKNGLEAHINSNADVTVMTAELSKPFGYGRIVRNGEEVLKIVEEKDANPSEAAINEVNSGIYFMNSEFFKSLSDKISTSNVQNEFYLTDCVEIAVSESRKVLAVKIKDSHEILGINAREQQAKVEKILRKRITRAHMERGVTFIDPRTAFVGKDVKIGKDTVIYPNTILEGNTEIGEDCVIMGSRISDSRIGNETRVENSVVLSSEIGEKTTVGPFAYIRPGCVVGNGNRIGDFVELKNSNIGDGTKVSHLTYVGDVDVGKNVNFGCGSVVVNYDGKKKHRSTIEDNVFVGCNVNLISPVKINKNAFLAAGSTINREVPEDALAIARARQENKEGWNKKS